MSIINEALKKTGQFIQENEAKNRPVAKNIHTAKPWLIYILILLAGIFLSKVIFDLISHKSTGHILITSDQNSKPQDYKLELAAINSKPALVTAPIVPLENNTPTQPSFVLNGIFLSDNDAYALVNNQIVRENDSVDGAKIIRITVNTVELDSNGKLTSLSTRR